MVILWAPWGRNPGHPSGHFYHSALHLRDPIKCSWRDIIRIEDHIQEEKWSLCADYSMCWQGCVTLSQQEELIFLVISLSHICQVLCQGTYKWKRMGSRQLEISSFLSRACSLWYIYTAISRCALHSIVLKSLRENNDLDPEKVSPSAVHPSLRPGIALALSFFLLLSLIFWEHWFSVDHLPGTTLYIMKNVYLQFHANQDQGPQLRAAWRCAGVPGSSSKHCLSKEDGSWSWALPSSPAPSHTCSPWWHDSFTSQEKGLSAWFSHREHTPGYYD